MTTEELVAFAKRLKSLGDIDAAKELSDFEHKCKITAVEEFSKRLQEVGRQSDSI